MATPAPAEIRNIALVGQGGSGKTTLTEHLLFEAKAIKRLGTVEEGTTVSDYTEEEKHHKHSLTAAVVHFEFHGHHVNLIDTPGLGDFLGHAVASMPAAETVAIVIDPARGIDSQVQRLVNNAADRKIPRMFIINKIDNREADLEGLVTRIREAFGSVCLPINLPTKDGKDVVNVFDHDGTDEAGDAADFSSVGEAHTAIIEQVVEMDEELMSVYLEQGQSLRPEQVHDAFETALGEGHLVPICFVSAKTGAGVEDLLHIFADLCPSPTEVSPSDFEVRAADGTEEEFHPEPKVDGKVVAHIFKVTADPFVGKLAFFRVHSGTVRSKQDLLINDQKKPLRVGHLFKVQGKEMTEVPEVGAGDIGALAKIEEAHFNGVLHDSHELDSLHLIPLPLPKPMFGLAVELKNHADEAKFSGACAKLMEEDPCFKVQRSAATKQTVILGLGELHLRVMLERLKNNFNIDLITSRPKVAYKETITGKAEGHHRHKKQTGGAGQFGEVFLRIEPLPADQGVGEGEGGEGFEFVSEVVGGTVPRQYWPAVEKGVRMVMADGAIAGYPMTGVRVALYDGKYHDVDSKEIAFITAGKKAFIDAVRKARPVLLEPYVSLEITAPSSYMGELAGLISGKRGRVVDSAMSGSDVCIVKATAPLGELQNLSNELKSLTGGQGSYTMDYSHDEPAPPQVQQEVMAAYKPHEEE